MYPNILILHINNKAMAADSLYHAQLPGTEMPLTKLNRGILGDDCRISLILTLASRGRAFSVFLLWKESYFLHWQKVPLGAWTQMLMNDKKKALLCCLSKTSGSTGRDVDGPNFLISKKNLHRQKTRMWMYTFSREIMFFCKNLIISLGICIALCTFQSSLLWICSFSSLSLDSTGSEPTSQIRKLRHSEGLNLFQYLFACKRHSQKWNGNSSSRTCYFIYLLIFVFVCMYDIYIWHVLVSVICFM